MPTNRTRIKRAVRSRVTEEARAIYVEARALQHIRDEHIRGMCPPPIGKHCLDCLKYMDLNRELGRLLGFKFWEVSPLDADTAEPPDYMHNNPWQAGLYRKAWALRCELEA